MTDANEQLILSPLTPDYESIKEALEADLRSTESWNNILTSGTGAALVRFLSSVAGYTQNGVARAQQEVFPDTARVPTSVYRAMRMLGVHIQRRKSGQVEATVTRPDTSLSQTIVKRTVFDFGGRKFYNPLDITFLPGQADRTVNLLQGEPMTAVVASTGNDYQRFATSVRTEVADQGVWALDSLGNEWTPVRDGLWKHEPDARVFHEMTLPDGRVEFWFGNNTYGATPPAGNLTLGWIRALDELSTSTPLSVGTTGRPIGFVAEAVTTTTSSSNEDARPVDFYKIMGPKIGAAFNRAVTRDDYAGLAVEFPGVIDAIFRGQAELNPSDVRYMNIIGATLITTSVWSQLQFERFARYFEREVGIATTTVIRSDPTVVPVDVNLEIKAFNRADLEDVDRLTREVITQFFKPKTGSLGAFYHPSDMIINVMQKCSDDLGTLIDYVNPISPNTPIEMGKTSYATLRSVTLSVSYTERTSNATYAVRATGL